MINVNDFANIKEKFFNKQVSQEDYKLLIEEINDINNYKDFLEFVEKQTIVLKNFISQKEENFNKRMKNLITCTNERLGIEETRM